MNYLYNPQISQDLDSAEGILVSLLGLGTLGFTGITAIIALVTAIVSFIITVTFYLLQSIPLFIMARKAGYKHAWMAFFPYTNDFLTFILPAREFNVFNWIKSNKRDMMALIYLGLVVFGYTALTILIAITSPIVVIGPLVSSFGGVVLTFFIYIFRWRMYYDLLMTYGQKSNALWVSIISLFIPWLFMIFTIFSCKNPPEYGAGNYYMCHQND